MSTRLRADRRSFLIGSTAALSASLVPWRALAETPSLSEAVANGETPPIAERLPTEPMIVDLPAKGREIGTPGGVLRTLIAKKKNIRWMNVWGYARLVGYDDDYALQPDILRAVEVDGQRAFTLHLRAGHKWSNGAPFTSEDFRYWWDDIANNVELSPAGPPSFMLIDGEAPEFTVLSDTAVRYAWRTPNPLFLGELAKARPPFIYRPSHYLRRAHARYVDAYELLDQIAARKVRNWAQLHNRLDNMYKNDNPELPSLQPWVNATDGAAQRYKMVRNPYFHRVDTQGQQLPYADSVEMSIAATGLIAAKAKAGEVDLQAKGLDFSDVGVLKASETEGGYLTRLWPSGAASHIALYPNLTAADPIWRELMRDARFRRALSLGIDRQLINQALYFGLAEVGGNTAISASPFYDEANRTAWAAYDPKQSNAMLDDIGLTERRGDGVRLLSDGRPLEIVIETAGERPEEVKALELIAETWREIGVKLLVRPTDRDIMRNRTYSGRAVMTVWSGWDNGAPTANSDPAELAPVRQDVLCWSAWGQHHQTGGMSGERPPAESEAERLMKLYDQWLAAGSDAERADIWREMLAIHADQQYVIGVICEAPQPIVVSNRLRNVPERALYAWEPGGHFGVHRMDEFWFADAESAALDAAEQDA